MTRVLITGAGGMDGSHLADQLLLEGHEVFGLLRGQRMPEYVPKGMHIIRADVTDQASLISALQQARPGVVYNLAAVTSIGLSWGQPALMSNVTGLGILRLLGAIRFVDKSIRVVQASSADQFGEPQEMADLTIGFGETSSFAPRSPYGVAKQFAHDTCISYREAYGMHVSTLIWFNHSSERQGTEFVLPKICRAAARIGAGDRAPLKLGTLAPSRDLGYAPDYVRAYPLAAAQDEPGDYVIATGKAHTLREMCEAAFTTVGLDYRDHVELDPQFKRPADVAVRVGNARKAEMKLGWAPTVGFDEMIEIMVKQ